MKNKLAFFLFLIFFTRLGVAQTEIDPNYYLGASAGGAWSGDLSGSALSVRIGWIKSKHHGFEVEFTAIDIDADSNVIKNTPRGVISEKDSVTRTSKNEVKLEEYLLMFNYRYQGFIDRHSKIPSWPFYLGAGVGFNFLERKNQQTFTITVKPDTGSPIIGTRSDTITKSNTEGAGQVFAGIGYLMTEQLSLSLGGRLLFTRDFRFTDGFGNNVLDTDELQGVVEVSLTFIW